MKKFFFNSGFTLLELLVAITIISLAISAILSLFIITLRSSGTNKNELIALNLAREGLELVRNIRDNQWKKCTSFQARGEGIIRYCSEWDKWVDTNNDQLPDSQPNNNVSYLAIINPFLEMSQEPYLVSGNNFALYLCQNETGGEAYVHENICPSLPDFNSQILPFSRSLTFTFLDLDQPPDNSTDQIIVTSQINWQEKGQDKQIEVEEYLYNWYTK